MEGALGYVPNSFFTMARNPLTLKAVGAFMDALWYPDDVDEPTRRLVTFAYSHFAGSFYSSAHCACGAEELGLAKEKIDEVFDYETSPVYSNSERALLRLCRHAARIPSEVTDRDIETLKAHFDDSTITFIVGLIALMAFLNKWNELIDTTLEPVPFEWAETNLKTVGWHMER